MTERVIRASLLALLIAAPGLSSFAQDIPPRTHAIGAELGFLSVPFDREDPYSFAALAGLWYDWRPGPQGRFGLGLWADAAGFRPLDPLFGYSFMATGGLDVNWLMPVLDADTAWAGLGPFVRAGWYLRYVSLLGSDEWLSRPYMAGGLRFMLYQGKSMVVGMDAQVVLPIDRTVPVLVALIQRFGLCF